MGWSRRNFMVPLPRFASLEALNLYLEQRCRERQGDVLRGHRESIAKRLERDLEAMTALPGAPFDACHQAAGQVSSQSLVKDYVREHRRHRREMFVPLTHPPGHAQADFGEAWAVIAGVKQKVHFFAFDLPQSDASYVRAYRAATAEAWVDGHVHAFSFFGAVALSIVYDNDRCLVSRIERDGTRRCTRLFSGFLSHYLIGDRYRQVWVRGYAPGTNPIEDAAGNNVVALNDEPVTNNTADITAPALSTATVDGTALVLTYPASSALSHHLGRNAPSTPPHEPARRRRALRRATPSQQPMQRTSHVRIVTFVELW